MSSQTVTWRTKTKCDGCSKKFQTTIANAKVCLDCSKKSEKKKMADKTSPNLGHLTLSPSSGKSKSASSKYQSLTGVRVDGGTVSKSLKLPSTSGVGSKRPSDHTDNNPTQKKAARLNAPVVLANRSILSPPLGESTTSESLPSSKVKFTSFFF